jgi:hypothetical protein
MTITDAHDALLDGKRVRHKLMHETEYLEPNGKGGCVDEFGYAYSSFLNTFTDCYDDDGWMVCNETILNNGHITEYSVFN